VEFARVGPKKTSFGAVVMGLDQPIADIDPLSLAVTAPAGLPLDATGDKDLQGLDGHSNVSATGHATGRQKPPRRDRVLIQLLSWRSPASAPGRACPAF